MSKQLQALLLALVAVNFAPIYTTLSPISSRVTLGEGIGINFRAAQDCHVLIAVGFNPP